MPKKVRNAREGEKWLARSQSQHRHIPRRESIKRNINILTTVLFCRERSECAKNTRRRIPRRCPIERAEGQGRRGGSVGYRHRQEHKTVWRRPGSGGSIKCRVGQEYLEEPGKLETARPDAGSAVCAVVSEAKKYRVTGGWRSANLVQRRSSAVCVDGTGDENAGRCWAVQQAQFASLGWNALCAPRRCRTSA